jgi:hypothetical protein
VGLLQVTPWTRLSQGALALLLVWSTGCVKKTIEIRVHDPGRVGVNALDARGIVPVLPADGYDRSAPLAQTPNGQPPTVFRQDGQIAISWSPETAPLSVVDPTGLLPPQNPGQGVAMRGGWLYSTYILTPKRILPEGTRADYPLPIVVTTPLANVADAREVREPRRWPAYVFLPVGGGFTFFGASFLVLSSKDDTYKLAGATYLLVGIPLVIYGIVNALESADYVPLDLSAGR